jgi:hypothetical protein
MEPDRRVAARQTGQETGGKREIVLLPPGVLLYFPWVPFGQAFRPLHPICRAAGLFFYSAEV